MRADLQGLLREIPGLWLGQNAVAPPAVLPSGFPALDPLLPGGGWPVGTIVELVAPQRGIGEIQLILPAMRTLSRDVRVVYVNPPQIPYAPALDHAGVNLRQVLMLRPTPRDILWAMEKILGEQDCGMALAWTGPLRAREVRRLQLAAEKGQSMGFLFLDRDRGPSPAALRLRLRSHERGTEITILKSRGGYSRKTIVLQTP